MTETLTIRLPSAQRKVLRVRAAATGKTESEIVRELIAGLQHQPGSLRERAGRHFGRLDFAPASGDSDPWRAHQRKMNVRT